MTLDQIASSQSEIQMLQGRWGSSLIISTQSLPEDKYLLSLLVMMATNYSCVKFSYIISRTNHIYSQIFTALQKSIFGTKFIFIQNILRTSSKQQQSIIQMDSFLTNSHKFICCYTTFYALFGCLYILRAFLDAGFLSAFKIFPLVILVLISLKQWKNRTTLKVILAVVFGALGDLVLQYGGEDLFPAGAGCFLIGHVFYNVGIIQLWTLIQPKLLIQRKLIILVSAAFFLSISSMNMATTVTDKLKDENFLLVILLPIYLVLLSLNCVNTIILICGSEKVSKWMLMLFIGTFFFYVSDNVLGKAVFADFKIGGERKYNSVVIMVTYYLGQYFIVHSIKAMSDDLAQREKPQKQESLLQSQ